MKPKFLILIFTLSLVQMFSQTFNVGHCAVNFKDPTRPSGGYAIAPNSTENGNLVAVVTGTVGRDVGTEIYYPALTNGNNTTPAAGTFPVIVFGHGFQMTWNVYDNIWLDFVSNGYIVCFLRTEGSLSPSHTDFGKDLSFVAAKMLNDINVNVISTPMGFPNLVGKLSGKSALMGHSMGGGSSFLGAANNTTITTLVNFAAAQTNPRSSAAAKNVTVPTLIIGGQNDCVAPPPANQLQMYDSTIASCKAYILIKGGGHCYFANNSLQCSFGEATCSPSPTITRPAQQSTAQLFTKYWLGYFLKNDCLMWNSFNDSITLSNRVTYQKSCSVSCSVSNVKQLNFSRIINVYPNPTSGEITVDIGNNSGTIQLVSIIGNELGPIESIDKKMNFDLNNLSAGMYFLKTTVDGKEYLHKVVKQ